MKVLGRTPMVGWDQRVGHGHDTASVRSFRGHRGHSEAVQGSNNGQGVAEDFCLLN